MASSKGEICSTVDEKFICTICTHVLCDPHLTGCCGQHFCESCLKTWLTTQGKKKSCPHCRAEGKEFQHLLDKKLKREINSISLKIPCPNEEEGCKWVGEVRSLKDHLESENGCGYVEVKCPNKCLDSRCFNRFRDERVSKIKRNKLENHLWNECYLRPYQCEYCKHEDTYLNITGGSEANYDWSDETHYAKCSEFPLECPNFCGKKYIKRKDMKDHRSQCPEEEVECPNKCNTLHIPILQSSTSAKILFSITMKRKDLAKHLSEVCNLRLYQCEYCGLNSTYNAVVSHYRECLEFFIECPNQCGAKDIKRKDVEDHRSQCPEEQVECPFEEAGCKEKLVRRELEQHMSTTQQQHLLMVMGAYKEVKKANVDLQKENTKIKKKLHEINTQQRPKRAFKPANEKPYAKRWKK